MNWTYIPLHKAGKLRGCMGRFGGNQPLYEVIEEMAQSAAFGDPRFYPLQPSELNEVDIEISVLTPLKRIYILSEFSLGAERIYLVKGGKSGTFLPPLATVIRWRTVAFVAYCSIDNAELGWSVLQRAYIYAYTAM